MPFLFNACQRGFRLSNKNIKSRSSWKTQCQIIQEGKKIGIGLLGLGTVGEGVARILQSPKSRHHLVSDIGQNGHVQINQDFNFFVSEVDAQKSLSFELSQGRQAYAVCVEGSLKIKSMLLERHEACEMRVGNEPVSINFDGQKGKEKTHVLLYEMKD